MSINEFMCTSEAILHRADFLMPPWKSQILKNRWRDPWTGHDINTQKCKCDTGLCHRTVTDKEAVDNIEGEVQCCKDKAEKRYKV